jgi:hypothetical protein
MEPNITDWLNVGISILSLLIASIALWFAYRQIRQVNAQLLNLNDTFRNSTLMTVLELENELIRRKVTWDSTNFELRQYSIDTEMNQTELNLDVVELIQDKEKTALENYLNSLDRFCYCIIHNYISDRDWKTEYREVVFDIVDNRPEKFGVNSRFRNTIKIYKKWKDE